jgi:hypothetical protein
MSRDAATQIGSPRRHRESTERIYELQRFAPSMNTRRRRRYASVRREQKRSTARSDAIWYRTRWAERGQKVGRFRCAFGACCNRVHCASKQALRE